MPKPTPSTPPEIVAVGTQATSLFVEAATRALDTNQFTPDPTKRYEISLSGCFSPENIGYYLIVWNMGGNEQHLILPVDLLAAGQQEASKRILLEPGVLPSVPMVIGVISFSTNITISPNNRTSQIIVTEWPSG